MVAIPDHGEKEDHEYRRNQRDPGTATAEENPKKACQSEGGQEQPWPANRVIENSIWGSWIRVKGSDQLPANEFGQHIEMILQVGGGGLVGPCIPLNLILARSDIGILWGLFRREPASFHLRVCHDFFVVASVKGRAAVCREKHPFTKVSVISESPGNETQKADGAADQTEAKESFALGVEQQEQAGLEEGEEKGNRPDEAGISKKQALQQSEPPVGSSAEGHTQGHGEGQQKGPRNF